MVEGLTEKSSIDPESEERGNFTMPVEETCLDKVMYSRSESKPSPLLKYGCPTERQWRVRVSDSKQFNDLPRPLLARRFCIDKYAFNRSRGYRYPLASSHNPRLVVYGLPTDLFAFHVSNLSFKTLFPRFTYESQSSHLVASALEYMHMAPGF